MRLLRAAYIFVRATAAPILEADGQAAVSGHPTAPAPWKWTPVAGGWLLATTPGGTQLHVMRLNTSQVDAGDGVWLVVEREPEGTGKLEELAAAGSNTAAGSIKALWEAARGGDTVARAVLRHLPDWKVSGFERDGEGGTRPFTGTRRIFPRDSGARIPAAVLTGGAGPWHLDAAGDVVPHLDPLEVLHVTSWHRPGFAGPTMFGYDDTAPEAGTPED